ncbi:GIY-YIG nuclease family protein [Robertkochia aurantiaca]|uniref:GIY-YIG nuclease family protein n=1 Tax=Robertkochia aurantiaca TaxID=2873700 RepID=UPI001CC9351E|nr:GIY-YIG nuclease family protein [Robertkochia sp. 3YJGBD-33]
MRFYYVYILECSDGSFYTGFTSDVDKRVMQHNDGKVYTSYTYSRRPVKLVWVQEFSDPKQAISFEKQVKGWRRKKKEALINGDFNLLKELSKPYNKNNK